MHTELVSYFATAPGGGAGAAASPFVGDSLTAKNSRTAASILAWWALNQTAGYHQLTFPSGHDTTRGLRTVVAANSPDLRAPLGLMIDVQPQELMSLVIAGSATAGDVETGHMILKYDDLPGVTSRMMGWSDLQKQGKKSLTIQATLTATASGYTGSELITVESDLLRANQDYAIVGIESTVNVGAVWLNGPDTGYCKVAVPGYSTRTDITGGFFGMLSRAYGDADLIPVINSGNKSSTYIGLAANETVGDVVVSLNLVLL